MHFLLSQYFTVLWNIMTSTWVTVLEFKGCLKHLPAWVSFQMPNCFPGLRWCSENLGSGSPHLFGAWIRRRLLQLGQSRREVSWCLVISAQWVDLHQYWVSQDSKDFQSEQMRIRYPQNSTYLHNLEDAKKTYPNMSICETTEFCGRPDF